MANAGIDGHARRRDTGVAGQDLGNEQRDAQHRLVREDAVRQLAVIAEALAMISGDHDQRWARLRGKPIEQ